MMQTRIPVLIAGGGTVGLAAALFLSGKGVDALIVEQQDGPSPHPRATGMGRRTMEMLRAEGLQDAVNAVCVNMTGGLGKIYVRTLADTDFDSLPVPAHQTRLGDGGDDSPAVVRGTCPQHRLDSVLLPAIRERGVELRYSTRLESFTQDADGVEATLSDGSVVHADYLIAADGVRSEVRTALGTEVGGPGPLGKPMMSIMFRADLTPYLRGHRFVNCTVDNPAVSGLLVTIDGANEWILHVECTDAADEFTPARCLELIRAAIGDDTCEVDVVSALPWRPRGQLAQQFRVDRVFLAGDAAHTVPPLGAFGLNTGIADAHNLAWKIAAVLRGEAGESLLETYDSERRPVAAMTLDQAVRRLRDPRLHWDNTPEIVAARQAAGVIHAPLVHIGYRYDSAAVIDPQPELPSTEDVSLALDGTPGSLLPHRWVHHHGRRVPTIDLIDGFTLLTPAENWARAAHEAAHELGVALTVHRIPAADGDWAGAVGIDEDGALLVRPDHMIAWRSTMLPTHPRGLLIDVLGAVLARIEPAAAASNRS
ncbi:FAD-dependent monooxygenase [Nocardia sp. NBC_00511]|uniref:FAD-dependent monooxygenase n=1 Tax=Nocardia sp. NBC_00511 TaxID=2903591 RepID=UPI0030E0AAA3